MNFEAGTGSSG